LRIETVINDPGEFRVRRPCRGGGLSWQPLLKGWTLAKSAPHLPV
jgi:hypothetical protein